MKDWLRKLIVVLPVIITGFFYLRILYDDHYSNASFKRIAGFVLSVLALGSWFVFLTIRKKQDSLPVILIQSSFFVYIFFVLQLTGYFILFKEISSHGWWDKMDHRVQTHEHVNFTAFKTIGMYSTFDKQIAGNFVMLLPLGIYLPLLYPKLRKLSGFIVVLLISFLVSVGIEVLQLATNYRSTDIDDVILNTAGACTGFLIYLVVKITVSRDRTEPIHRSHPTA